MYHKAAILLIIATAFSGSALCANGSRVTHAYGADASQVLGSVEYRGGIPLYRAGVWISRRARDDSPYRLLNGELM